MLSFAVYSNSQLVNKLDLPGAYVVGTDDVPLRAEISFADGIITCQKRASGPAGLALLWPVAGVGTTMLDTIRLLERDKPYILQVELARSRLMRIQHKLEDWGLLDYAGVEEIGARIEKGRDALIRALQADTPAEAAIRGDEALAVAVKASEELSHYHASVLFNRRKQAGGFGRRVFGCSVPPASLTETIRERLTAAFDFVTIPFHWRDIEPSEQTFHWKPLDTWVESLAKHNIPMKASALLSFNEKHVPDWLYIWEHDFDTIRDLALEHVRRVLNRYGQYIQVWDVISGIHADNCFTFSFEQLMELTRMAAAMTKELCPRSIAIIDLVAPWGEYYARNQRTVPPLLYADMTMQSGVNFDAFGLQFYFGPGSDLRRPGYVRDMFQISSLLDAFVKLGRPLHITAVQVPSQTAVPQKERGAGDPGAPGPIEGGIWHEPWSEPIQSEWLRQFLTIALSKPFVETVSWHSLTDHGKSAGRRIPYGGLLRPDHTPKAAYDQLIKTRAEVLGNTKKT